MGRIRTYVGPTARSMGSDPAYAAFPENGPPAVFEDHDNAVYWLQRHGDDYIVTDQEDQ